MADFNLCFKASVWKEWHWFSVESYDQSRRYMMWLDWDSDESVREICNRKVTVGIKKVWMGMFGCESTKGNSERRDKRITCVGGI